MWLLFSIVMARAQEEAFNVVSFSLFLVYNPKVDTSSLFYSGICDSFSPSLLLGANPYTSNVAGFSPFT